MQKRKGHAKCSSTTTNNRSSGPANNAVTIFIIFCMKPFIRKQHSCTKIFFLLSAPKFCKTYTTALKVNGEFKNQMQIIVTLEIIGASDTFTYCELKIKILF